MQDTLFWITSACDADLSHHKVGKVYRHMHTLEDCVKYYENYRNTLIKTGYTWLYD